MHYVYMLRCSDVTLYTGYDYFRAGAKHIMNE